MPGTLRERLQDALPAAVKTRDRTAVAVLRATLAALSNAEAVTGTEAVPGSLALERLPVGAGATEVARRDLTETDVVRIVRAEVDEREAAAARYDAAGRAEQATRLRDEARVLTTFLH